ncbi:histidine phosphatase family protein [Rugosimonospora acidiphila]|uniref:Histidine phosphatase family protein n=1 Tax=Rugosimonospora acidiphila TaxID=556531 RepID=A0ABP9RYT3_9ACTN
MSELAWLGVVRHGQSAGNVAAERAEAAGEELVDLRISDADVRLTETGREQGAAIGRWMAELPSRERPQVVFSSPYRRAMQTAELAVAAAGFGAPPLLMDERLRDRELGVLDLLTSRGVTARRPEEAERKRRLGRFYYRPPGGESWADVALRLRTLLGDLRLEYPGQRVLLVAHESVIFLLRYVIERLSQERLLELVEATTLANASLCSWRRDDGRLRPSVFNWVGHLTEQGVPTTQQEQVVAQPGRAPRR